jgi:hypothetical protein
MRHGNSTSRVQETMNCSKYIIKLHAKGEKKSTKNLTMGSLAWSIPVAPRSKSVLDENKE